MDTLGKRLIEKQWTIASVESFTVGGFASCIGSVPGISAVYRGSAVTYQTMMKEKLLKIDHDLINTYGVVSANVAYEMAKAGQQLFESDICISFTGNSGPSAMENKPVGLCFIGIAFFDAITTYELHLSGSRQEIKDAAIAIGIEKLKQLIETKEE